jgi:hypothetical protein
MRLETEDYFHGIVTVHVIAIRKVDDPGCRMTGQHREL